MVFDTSASKDVSIHQIWDSSLKLNMRYAPDTIIVEIRSRSQKLIHDTLPSYDATTHQIWDS